MANVSNVVKELGYPLINGMADPAKTLPEFQKKLKDAGMDKIVAEAQKQIDAWKATKK
jgi:putative aldouronate transport system substrate-binding protein